MKVAIVNSSVNNNDNTNGELNNLSEGDSQLQIGAKQNQRSQAEVLKEAKTLRKFALSSLCFAFISLLTAVLLPPLLFSHSRIVQSAIDSQTNGCLDKLARLYNRMDRMIADSQTGYSFKATASDYDSGKARSARHVFAAAINRHRLKQAIKNQRNARYLQQKLAETTALLNTGQVWNDVINLDINGNDNKIGEKNPAGIRNNIKNNNGDNNNKSYNERGDRGAEVVEPDDASNSERKLAASNNKLQRSDTNTISPSASFEISSEHFQWHKPNKQASIGSFDFTTSFPFYAASSSFANPHSNGIRIETYSSNSNKEQPESAGTDDVEEQCNCCLCVQGAPGPPGFAGTDGQLGRDGWPGKNGLNGVDAPKKHESTGVDFCFSCPRGSIGETGQQGSIGVPGEPGRAGDNGEDGRKGTSGRRGPTGAPGQHGNPGPTGTQGIQGRIVVVQGPEGTEGNTGPLGPAGLPGIPGNSGISLCGRPGLQGEPGLDGRNGAVGQIGKQGEQGKQGSPGECGHCSPPRTAPGY